MRGERDTDNCIFSWSPSFRLSRSLHRRLSLLSACLLHSLLFWPFYLPPSSVSLSLPVSLYVSPRLNLFSSLSLSQSLNFSLTPFLQVFWSFSYQYLSLSPLLLHSLSVPRLYLPLYYLSPSLSLFSVFVSPL